ncbi:MAG TPA: LLM class F420-dependent oxidoreductase [Sporichthya sp.]|nr:LLM class F420-dependent oxidoreductase [Sporichthya sp.]
MTTLEFAVFTEPQQGASYDDLLNVARTAEDAGFDAFFRSDHYLVMGDGSGLPGPTDAWITLAGLARETSRVRLGTLVTAATFREPGPLAIAVAQVDVMSGGRVEFGLGAGWYEREHQAYGLRFPDTGERFDRFSEQLEIISGLWATEGGFSFSGKHYDVQDSPGLPKPVQRPGPPVIIGGAGAKRTPALAAQYAAEFNVAFQPIDFAVTQFGRVDDACRAAGRDPSTMRRSVAFVLCAGKNDSEVARRARSIGREVEELKTNGLAGTPAEIVDKLGRIVEATGIVRVYLQTLDLSDLAHLELVASDVLPAFR